MALCAHALSEHGVAYVSYNTLPGGHLRDIVRNILKAHVGESQPPAQQLAAARELLDVLRTAWAYDEQLSTLVSLATKMREDSDALLFHDTLSPINRRLYFDEFIAYSDRHELQFLAEANFWEMQVGWLPPGAARRRTRHRRPPAPRAAARPAADADLPPDAAVPRGP